MINWKIRTITAYVDGYNLEIQVYDHEIVDWDIKHIGSTVAFGSESSILAAKKAAVAAFAELNAKQEASR